MLVLSESPSCRGTVAISIRSSKHSGNRCANSAFSCSSLSVSQVQFVPQFICSFNGSLRDFRLLLRRGRKRLQLDSAFVLVGHRHDDDCWIRRHVPSNWTWQTRRFPLRNLRRSLHRTTRSLHRLEFPQTLSGLEKVSEINEELCFK